MSGLEEIPEDAAGFMIIGSKYDLSPQEADVLQRYWARPNAAVVAAWHDHSGVPIVRVLHQARGTRWVIDYLRMLRQHGAPQPVADAEGPTRRLIDAMGEGEVRTLTFAERRLDPRSCL